MNRVLAEREESIGARADAEKVLLTRQARRIQRRDMTLRSKLSRSNLWVNLSSFPFNRL